MVRRSLSWQTGIEQLESDVSHTRVNVILSFMVCIASTSGIKQNDTEKRICGEIERDFLQEDLYRKP
jgi:hypothetical protein